LGVLDDIAEAAGVSRMTVSNVLNGRTKETWPSTAARAAKIREIAAQMNYRPNSAAKAVVTGRFGALGLLSSSDISSGNLFPITLRAIARATAERDMHLTMGELPDEKLTSEGMVPKILREWAADGLLINYIASIPARMIELIEQHHIPSVWMNTMLKANCVYPDDYNATLKATEYLLQLGHKKIAYIHPLSSSHYSAEERRRGYEQAMVKARCKPQVIGYEGPSVHTDWKELSRAWLCSAERPTAIVAYEAIYAYPVYCAALSLGLDVPRDLSIITMHDEPALDVGTCLTTMLIPAAKIGQVAVETLLHLIDNPDTVLAPRALPFTLEEGATCAANIKQSVIKSTSSHNGVHKGGRVRISEDFALS
jgi:LacI family transcriptional regulator